MDESNTGQRSELKNMAIVSPAAAAEPAGAHPPGGSWRNYVRRVAEGDQAALATLYDESSTVVYSLAYRMLGSVAEAEEVTLEVYMQVWRSAARFDERKGTVFTWLVMLGRSRAIDRLRSLGRQRRSEEPLDGNLSVRADGDSPERASWLNQRRDKVRKAMAELSPEQREAIELAFFQGLSHGELAETLAQPLGTIKTRIRLGMIKLRQLLGSEALL
jgi:RNA polymerase sigma-70 factor, ECF subfamily